MWKCPKCGRTFNNEDQTHDCGKKTEAGDGSRSDRIERVKKFEKLFEEAIACPDEETLRLLDEYYTSGQWREDYEADENGELPPALKRGVLSQDALYDLLTEAKTRG